MLQQIKLSEPTGSGTPATAGSLEAFISPKREISKVDFSWDEPLKPTIWSLFDIAAFFEVETDPIQGFFQRFEPFI